MPAGIESFLREYLPATLKAELVAPTSGDGLAVPIAAGRRSSTARTSLAGPYLS